MKKIGYILLISILFLQLGGLLLLYKVQQYKIQYEMKEALYEDGAELQKLILSIAEFEKSKIDKHEIYYKGKMYDFKSAIIKNNTVELLVINDAKEEILYDLIRDLFTGTDKQKNKLPNQLSKLLTLTYLSSDKYIRLFPPIHKNIFSVFTENIISADKKVSSPPPDVA